MRTSTIESLVKRVIVLTGLVISTNTLFGQTSADEAEIWKTYQKYVKSFGTENIEEHLDYYYPRFFELNSRDTLVQALQMAQSIGRIRIEEPRLKSISTIHTIDGIRYALLTSNQTITSDFSSLKGEGGIDFAIKMMLSELCRQHGKENVSFDEKSYVLKTTSDNQIYAILDPKYDGWKFLPTGDAESVTTDSIVPQEIQLKLQ